MKMIASTLILLTGFLLVDSHEATAQTRGRTSSPTMRRNSKPVTSPYLNLLNRNNSTAGNYFTQVRPQQEFYAADNQLRQSIDSVQKQVNVQQQMLMRQSSSSMLSQSGHQTSFFSNGSYYSGR